MAMLVPPPFVILGVHSPRSLN